VAIQAANLCKSGCTQRKVAHLLSKSCDLLRFKQTFTEFNYRFLSALSLVVRVCVCAHPTAVDDRQRRKSGDDVLGSPTRKPTGALFEAFRPRSKSDATRAVKRPTIMSTVKNAVHVSSFALQPQLFVSLVPGRAHVSRATGEIRFAISPEAFN